MAISGIYGFTPREWDNLTPDQRAAAVEASEQFHMVHDEHHGSSNLFGLDILQVEAGALTHVHQVVASAKADTKAIA